MKSSNRAVLTEIVSVQSLPSRTFSIGESVQWLGALVRCWMTRCRTRQALAKLDDRLLRDVGLTREMIRDEISKPFWRA